MDAGDAYNRPPNEALQLLLAFKSPTEVHHMDENRSGFPIYDGNIYEFKEWQYKLNLRTIVIGTDSDDAKFRRQLAAGFANGLRGRAAVFAWEIGAEAMANDDMSGFDRLSEKLHEYHTPLK